MKVYLVSDVHTDYPANMEWWATSHGCNCLNIPEHARKGCPQVNRLCRCQALPERLDDILILAGKRDEQSLLPAAGVPCLLPSHGLDHSSAAKRPAAASAGDLSDNVETFTSTLRCFAAKYKHCFYTPGNHCLWVRNGEEKLRNSLGEQLVTALAALSAMGASAALSLLSWRETPKQHA